MAAAARAAGGGGGESKDGVGDSSWKESEWKTSWWQAEKTKSTNAQDPWHGESDPWHVDARSDPWQQMPKATSTSKGDWAPTTPKVAEHLPPRQYYYPAAESKASPQTPKPVPPKPGSAPKASWAGPPDE